MTTFNVNVIKSGRAAVEQVRGELDLSTSPRLRDELASLTDDGVLEVTVDLAELDFDDSSGLQVLVAGFKRSHEQGGDLELRSPRPSTRKVLEITGLTSAFRLESIECPGIHRRICGVGQDAHRRMTGDPYVTVD